MTNITVHRTDEWVAQKRLETGQNTPGSVQVQVDPVDLGKEARSILLQLGRGSYPSHIRSVAYNAQYELTADSMLHPSIPIVVDADDPTPAQIEAAILAAAREVREKKQQWQAQREQERQQKQREQEARELLADELRTLHDQLAKLRDDRETLAKFLATIPQDALRGALKSGATSREAVDRLQQQIENASPVYIFDNDADE